MVLEHPRLEVALRTRLYFDVDEKELGTTIKRGELGDNVSLTAFPVREIGKQLGLRELDGVEIEPRLASG